MRTIHEEFMEMFNHTDKSPEAFDKLLMVFRRNWIEEKESHKMNPVEELERLGDAVSYVSSTREYLKYNMDFARKLYGEQGVKLVNTLQNKRMGFVNITQYDLISKINNGDFFDTTNAKVMSMPKQNGYSNSEFLYRNQKGKYNIIIGYAFNIDEWVSHAWVVDKNNILYETTPHLRDEYFGIPIMTKRDFKKFLKSYMLEEQ